MDPRAPPLPSLDVFRRLYEAAPGAFLALAPDRPRFTIVAVSDAYLAATGTSRDIVGRGIFEVFPDDPSDPESTGNPARESFERVLDTRSPDTMAVQKHSIPRPESEGGGFEERYWSPLNTPVLGDDGEVLYLHHRVEDVTEFVRAKQKTVEQDAVAAALRTRAGEMEADVLRRAQVIQETNRQLRAANARLAELDREREQRVDERVREGTALLQVISDTSPDILFAKDREGRMLFANPAALALIGKPLDQVIGKTDAEFLDDEVAARQVRDNDRRIMERGVPEEVEERVPLPDGSERIWLSRKTPYRDRAGNVVGLLGTSRDITERKRAEDALRATEERWNAAIENFSEGAIIATEDEQVIYWNPAARAMHGFTSEREGLEPLARTPETFELWTPDGQRLLTLDEWPMRRIKRGEPVHRVELRLRRPDQGWERFVSYSGAMVRTSSGERLIFLSVTDLTEQRRAELALREADRRKDEFLAMLSHELRNPIAPIRNSLYVLDHAEPTGQQARRAKDVANRQVAHLTRLVDDLLDVTRIARGRFELRRVDVDLAALVRRTADDHRALMRERGLDLVVAVPDDPVVVNADDTRLAQVLGNLLSNAAKFTPAGGRVTLAVQRSGGRVVVQVRDTGPGIEPDLLPAIFDPFTQAKQTLARSEGGLGLGLALVKTIVDLHGGRVAATSSPGGGAEFTLELPVADVDVSAHAVAPARAVTRAYRVLVVDDNADAADSLAELVRTFGHEADVAYDGPSAVASAEARRPDVVLCDIGLPGMDGYEVARELRAKLEGDVKLVAVSGYAQPEDVKRSAEAGFDAHISKPPDPARIERLFS
jgi:PAS domain S-box-containing protein